MAREPLAVSAPGKVLFTGGFLVLDRKHTGLVLGLDARIHVHVEAWKKSEISTNQEGSTMVLVQSPQFRNAKWLYNVVNTQTDLAVQVRQVTE